MINLTMTGSSAASIASNFKTRYWWLINKALAFTPPGTMIDLNSNPVTLSDFWINIAEIELKVTESVEVGEVSGSSVEFAGPYLINIFSTSPSPLVTGAVAQNSIRRIRYKTQKITGVSGGNPADMVNCSMYLAGNVNGKNFKLLMGEEISFETAGPNLVTFDSGDTLLMQVESAEIIRKIDLSILNNNDVISNANKVNATNPCPSIDASARDLYTCFIKAFQLKTKLGKDVNDDASFNSGDETVN